MERKIGAGAWAALTAGASLTPGTVTFEDATVARYTVSTVFHYRVRAKGTGTIVSGAAEVATVGQTNQWGTGYYDTDADGITDADETTQGLNPLDWTDGTGDKDGDGMPNAWEESLGFDSNSAASPTAAQAALYTVTVDASRTIADTATETKTISAAITKFTGGTSSVFPYRIIRVRPGVYLENINNASYYQIALLPERTVTANVMAIGEHFEIQGAADGPVIQSIGSFVVDGFIITRAADTQGSALLTEDTPATRISPVRMVNCLVRDMNLGSASVVDQTGGRVVLANCTFYMNGCSNAVSHSYTAGSLIGAVVVDPSTARLQVHNSIFWNPINTTVPEFFETAPGAVDLCLADSKFITSICFGSNPPADTSSFSPGLTPRGYVASGVSAAALGGTAAFQAPIDMHGEVRTVGRGADTWVDGDGDGIPNFADSEPGSGANAYAFGDDGYLTQYGEYILGTDLSGASNTYMTLSQGLMLFRELAGSEDYLTRTEGDARYLLRNPTPLQTIRVAPGGNISMGQFTTPPPAP
ncbi:MAG: hypothetical protein ABL974_14810 [Prosthecobacter sp.]